MCQASPMPGKLLVYWERPGRSRKSGNEDGKRGPDGEQGTAFRSEVWRLCQSPYRDVGGCLLFLKKPIRTVEQVISCETKRFVLCDFFFLFLLTSFTCFASMPPLKRVNVLFFQTHWKYVQTDRLVILSWDFNCVYVPLLTGRIACSIKTRALSFWTTWSIGANQKMLPTARQVGWVYGIPNSRAQATHTWIEHTFPSILPKRAGSIQLMTSHLLIIILFPF